MKKLFTLAAAVLASFSLWAATESNPTADVSSNDNVVGTSYSIDGNYVAGLGGTKAGDMQTKGIKFRLNRAVGETANAVEFKVNEGYVISQIDFCGHVNDNSKTSTITEVKVDGTSINFTPVNLPAKSSSTSFSISGIQATESIVMVFSGDGTQANLEYTVTYEEATTKTITSTVETLTNAKINGVALDPNFLSELIDTKSVEVLNAYITAPTVTFTKHVVITYDDESTKESDVDVEVVAIGSNQWTASITLGDDTYLITMPRATAYTVTYLYGTDTLGTEVVAAGGHPAEYAQYEVRPLSTFNGWRDGEDYIDEVDMTQVVVNSDMSFYADFVKAYAQSINIEQWVLDNGKNNTAFKALLQERGFAYENINDLDSLNDDPSKANRNEPYLGLKIKKQGGYIAFNVLPGQTLAVKFGYGEAPIKINVNGVDSTCSPVEKNLGEFELSAAQADTYIKISTTSDKTVVIKQIMINEAIADVVLPGQPEFTAAAAPAVNGSILLNGVDTLKAHQGDTIMVTYTAASGYQIDTIKVDGKAIKEDQGIYKFVMPGNDVTVTATFKVYEETSFAITIAQSIANGNVSLNKYSANQGDTIIVTATPYDGYKIGQVTYGNEVIVPVDGIYFFIMPAHAVEVNATFIPNEPVVVTEYNITIAEMENGSVSADKEKAQKGEIVTLTVTPAEGYKIADVKVNDNSLNAVEGVYSFEMPEEDVTITATFEQTQGIDEINAAQKAVKRLENGLLIIEKNGVLYNVQGARVR